MAQAGGLFGGFGASPAKGGAPGNLFGAPAPAPGGVGFAPAAPAAGVGFAPAAAATPAAGPPSADAAGFGSALFCSALLPTVASAAQAEGALLGSARIVARRGDDGSCLVAIPFFGAACGPRAVWVDAAAAAGLPEEAPRPAGCAASGVDGEEEAEGKRPEGGKEEEQEEGDDDEEQEQDGGGHGAAFVAMLLADAPPTATLLRALLTSLEDGDWRPRAAVPSRGSGRRLAKAVRAIHDALVSAARAAASQPEAHAAGGGGGGDDDAAERARLASELLVRLASRGGTVARALVLRGCLGGPVCPPGDAAGAWGGAPEGGPAGGAGGSVAVAPALPAIVAALAGACPSLGAGAGACMDDAAALLPALQTALPPSQAVQGGAKNKEKKKWPRPWLPSASDAAVAALFLGAAGAGAGGGGGGDERQPLQPSLGTAAGAGAAGAGAAGAGAGGGGGGGELQPLKPSLGTVQDQQQRMVNFYQKVRAHLQPFVVSHLPA